MPKFEFLGESGEFVVIDRYENLDDALEEARKSIGDIRWHSGEGGEEIDAPRK